MRMIKLLTAVFLSMVSISCGYSLAEESMTVSLSSSKATSGAIVTLECSIQCDRLMGTNCYFVFDNSRIQLLNVEEERFHAIENSTAFCCDTNLFDIEGNISSNVIEQVNNCGYISIAIYDPQMEKDTSYFASEKKILTLQFQVLPECVTSPIQFAFYGKGYLSTSAVCSTGKLPWKVASGSGVITMVQTTTDGFTLQLPRDLKQIEDEAFFGGLPIEHVVIQGEMLERIGERAFADCVTLKSITIPSNVTSIGQDAFEGCTELIITCTEGSAAEKYAIENRIPYVLE